jgi:hypothetical protein
MAGMIGGVGGVGGVGTAGGVTGAWGVAGLAGAVAVLVAGGGVVLLFWPQPLKMASPTTRQQMFFKFFIGS